MRMVSRWLGVSMLLLLPWGALANEPQVWAGGAVIDGEFIPLALELDAENDSAIIVVPSLGNARLPGAAQRTENRLEINVNAQDGSPFEIRGEIERPLFRGTLRAPARKLEGPVTLVKLHKTDSNRLRAIAGEYELETGDRLFIEVAKIGEIEVLTGALGRADRPRRVLYPVSEDALLIAEPNALPTADGVRLHVPAGANPAELFFVQPDGSRRKATRTLESKPRTSLEGLDLPLTIPGGGVRSEDLWIEAKDVRLRATLILPPGESEHAAAVIVHGSSCQPRARLEFHVRLALNAGLAVLAYDKRGCGESTGVFEPFSVEGSAANFRTLADDALAAHAWLRNQPHIDPDRVGFLGGSQAGWIMPLAASRGSGVAFIAAVAGCAVSTGEEMRHAQLVRSRSIPEADEALRAYEGPRGFDPRPILESLQTPMLWMFGDRDPIIPTRASLEVLDDLVRNGHTMHTVHVFPDCDHNMVDPDTGRRPHLVPVLAHWLSLLGITS